MQDLSKMSKEELTFFRNELYKKYDKLLIEAENLAIKLKEVRQQIEKLNSNLNGS